MLFQNVGDAAARNFVAQIGQRSLNSAVAPIPVLRSHADDQLLDLVLRTRTPRASLLAAIVLFGDQPPMPSQESRWRDDGDQIMEYPANPIS